MPKMNRPAKNMAMIWTWGIGMLLCSALALLINVTANRMSITTSREITGRIRADLFDRILHLSATQEDAFTTPSLISRLTSDMRFCKMEPFREWGPMRSC